MTVSEMDDLVAQYVGRRTDVQQPLRLLYLNEAQKDLSVGFFFDNLETLDESLVTVSGTPDYDALGGNYVIEQMKNVTLPQHDYPLSPRDWDWYTENHSDQTDITDAPVFWTMREGRIWFDPTPDGAYTMRITGRRLPADMSVSPLVQPEIDSTWHLIVVMQAAADILFLKGNDARAMVLKNEYLGKISSKQEKRTLRRLREGGQLKVQFSNPRRRSRGRRSRIRYWED